MSLAITMGIVVITSVAVAVYVSLPLLLGKGGVEPAGDEPEAELLLDQLLVQKESTYSAIKELEFDHAMGNLSEQDYRELAARYEERAVALLQNIDEVAEESENEALPEDDVERAVAALRQVPPGRRNLRGAGQPEGDEIEQAVAALRYERKGRGSGDGRPEQSIEEQVASIRATRRAGSGIPAQERASSSTCGRCGSTLKNPRAAFCSRCGASLRVTCPGCGHPVEQDDFFCPGCGTSLSKPSSETVVETAIGGINA